MASALQCPACGHKHRLSELTGEPIFSCEQCGRLLKTPMEYRRPDPESPLEPPRKNGNSQVQRGGSAARDQTAVIRAPAAPAAGASARVPASAPAGAPSVRRRPPRPPATLSLPLMVLGWVVALVVGGVIVRYAAKFTGLLTGDSVIDLITGSGYGRYLRLFAVIPFWALATAGLMTLFVEGGRRWQARQGTPASPRPATRRAPAPAKVKRPRIPKASPNARPPAPSAPAPEPRAPTEAAAAPRTRRIPKRDISS